MASPINICILGAGRISSLNILGYLNNPSARIVSICDHNRKNSEKLAENIPYKVNIYDDLQQALKDPAVDLVEVLTPHRLHESHVIQIAEAGKHISCQKVPTLTLSSMDRMITSADKAGVKFRIFENFRYHPPYMQAQKLIDNGVIGKVENVNYRMWGTDNPLSSWDVKLSTWKWRIADNQNYKAPTLFDDGYHKHSIIAMYLGDFNEKITAIRAWSNRQRMRKVIPWDTPSVVIYETAKRERYGVWNVSIGKRLPIESNYYGGDEHLEIQGEHGIIFVRGCTGNLYQNNRNNPPGISWIDDKGEWHHDSSMPTDWKYSFINSTRDFVDSILNDDNNYQLNSKTARYILQINLATITSMRNDAKRIKLSSITDGVPDSDSYEQEDDI